MLLEDDLSTPLYPVSIEDTSQEEMYSARLYQIITEGILSSQGHVHSSVCLGRAVVF